MSRAQASTYHVRAHSSKTDHSKLHTLSSFSCNPNKFGALYRLVYRGEENFQALTDVSAQMHTQGSSLSVGKDLKVPPRLCRLDNSERKFLFRHRHIESIITRELKKDPTVGSAFVRLTCRMQEARSEAETGRHRSPISYCVANFLQRLGIAAIHF